jgi:murein DD-endopeptidase MepM/ murein hydrolase activator NlpD
MRPTTARRLLPALLAALLGTTLAVSVEVVESRPAAAEVRPIRFPVEGPVSYRDDFGEPRPGGRTHQGIDVYGNRLQRLLAARDAVVTQVSVNAGISGNLVKLRDAAGWEYWYIHLNNDTPGTDDGRNPPQWRFAPGIAVGVHVAAGQFIGYLGDSGNAEIELPQLHFEIHRPDGSAIDPYRSLRFSEWAARCSVAAPGVAKESALMPPVNAAMADASVVTSTGRGRFLLSLDGTVLAQGDADSVGWSRHAIDDAPCP